MAKHRRTRKHLAVVAGAVGMTAALTVGPVVAATADVTPAHDIVIGIGGNRNPTGDRIKRKFNGELVGELEADGYTFQGLQYPAQFPVDPSVTAGVPTLHAAIDSADGGRVVVIGYSQGALVAERVKRDLQKSDEPPNARELEFIFIASPFGPNGGIYSRFPGVNIPFFTNTGPAQPSQYDSTYYVMEYDIVADFPAYFNPLSLANSAVAFFAFHGDQGPDPVDLDTHPLSERVVEDNGKGGTDTYILVRATSLPLLTPVRRAAASMGATPLVEPVLAAIEPTLRVLVDMGYTDRDHRTIGVDPHADYQDAERPTPFSMITPADRTRESVEALPDALREGAQNFVKALPKPPAASKPKPTEAPATKDEDEDVGEDDLTDSDESARHRTGKHTTAEHDKTAGEDKATDDKATDNDNDKDADNATAPDNDTTAKKPRTESSDDGAKAA